MARSSNRLGAPIRLTFERQLQRELARLVRQVRATLPAIHDVGDVKKLRAALRREWSDAKILALVMEIGLKAEKDASAPWVRAGFDSIAVRTDAAFDGFKLLEKWAKTAAAYITSVREEVAEGLSRDVLEAAKKGIAPTALAARWRSKGIPLLFGTLEGRTKVIAQNQISTLHAQVQSARARAVGVTEFTWRTQGDSRVRPAHRSLEGTKHSYAEPPSEGLPGTPINCRCWAESVIPDELIEGVTLGRRISAR